jgi:tripartite-type tricarboxylate transporter receptor subunit TctC
VPSLAELGMPDFDVDLWFGALAPAGTPKPVIDRYNAVINQVLAEPRIRALLDKQGMVAQGGAPERLRDLIARDRVRWAEAVKNAGIASE